jgi:ubiquitin-protein ligase E3 C
MTKWFEMDRFIPAVVAEEEHKHEIQDFYGADANEMDTQADEEDNEEETSNNIIGTRRTQQVRNIERLRRQQRKSSRRKYLESVTPRLEILQNMPFFIPFATRVQIFREFVRLDQLRRRGYSDPDEWRYRLMTSSEGDITKYRAKVRRHHIFQDAYTHFYDLGEGLKEPIQISFVDQFDTVEEGIDGGGVTKEFLTSVTKEMFSPATGGDMFIESDHHLLYPNPSAIDELKEELRQNGLQERSAAWNDAVRDLLKRYEFLGRIIGKCLYEGILVDIHFAGFFLLKWALTGGSGAATKESSYRANINDLRDLDEGLYQGLVSHGSTLWEIISLILALSFN